MPALYPTVYSAEDQLNDLVYGASDYPNPNQQVMPTAGIASGYSSMPAPQEPAAQYPPTSPPPADANYVAQPAPAAGPDPFAAPYYPATGEVSPYEGGGTAAQSGAAPATAKASLNYQAEPFNTTSNPDNWRNDPNYYDAINVDGNVGQHNVQLQPWDSVAAPLEQPAVGPYSGPNFLNPVGQIDQMPGRMAYGGSGLDRLQRRMNGRQVEPAPYPPTEPTVTQLPRTGNPIQPATVPQITPSNMMGGSPNMDGTGGTNVDLIRASQQPGGLVGLGQSPSSRPLAGSPPPAEYNWAAAEPYGVSDRAIARNGMALGSQDAYGPPPNASEFNQAVADAAAQSQGANLGEGWFGGWDGLTAESRPTFDFLQPSSAGGDATQPTLPDSWYDAVDPTQTPTQTRAMDYLRAGWSPDGQTATTDSFLRNVDAAVAASGGGVGGRSSGAQPGSTPAPAKQPPAMWVLAPDGGLADVNDAGSAIAGLGDTGLPTLGVLNLEADGSITLNSTVAPKASLDAAAQRGEKAVALSNDEFNAIVAAGLMTNGDGSALTPEQVEVWRSALVGQPMLAPSEWMPYVADGTNAPPTFTPADAPAPVVADTSSPSTWNNTYSSNNYRGGGNYYRSSYGGARGGGGGGSWYDGGGSYPPSMPASMADFFGPDAFDSPIFDRMRGMMGSRRHGRRRGRRGMPMMPMSGREMPSRDVNLTVQGPVVNAGSAGDEALARALALRNR